MNLIFQTSVLPATWQWRLILCSKEIDIMGREEKFRLVGTNSEESRWVEYEIGIEENKYSCNGSITQLAQ